MRHLRLSDYRIMPWRNGGGSTTELAIFPERSDLSGDPFLWRVSIAEIIADGPFSRFPGYQRHIMVIEGDGMVLDAEDDGVIDLTKIFHPESFSGDWNVEGKLVGGPVRDFNFIVARSFAHSALRVECLSGRTIFQPNGDTRIIHVLDGEITANGHVVAVGETLVIGRDEAVEAKPLGDPAQLTVCRLTPF
jgi:hypothetical protein